MTTNYQVKWPNYRLTHHGADYIEGDDGTEYEVFVTYNQAGLDRMIDNALSRKNKRANAGPLTVKLVKHRRQA